MNVLASATTGKRSKRSRVQYDGRHRTQMLLLVAAVGVPGTTLAAHTAWVIRVSDAAPATTLQTGWETSPDVIAGFIALWIGVPMLLVAVPVFPARWLAVLGLVEAAWAILSSRGIETTGEWYSQTTMGSGPGVLMFVGIIAAGVALAVPPAEPLPAVDPTP